MQRAVATFLFFSIAVVSWAARAAQQEKPIVAVFAVQAKGVELDDGTLDRLSDYLATALTATGSFQVIPRAQLKQRLREQRKESYKNCYDQSCQIEIGRELAAQKSLAAQVIKLGSRCGVTATLYDLRRAATDRAATVKGACDEDGIVASLENVVQKLAPSAGRPEAAAQPTSAVVATPAGPPPPMVSVEVETEPRGAEVFVDGQARGITPIRLDLVKGKQYALSLEKPGYQREEAQLKADKRQQLRIPLGLTAAGRVTMMTRTEWFNFELLGGGLINGDGNATVGGGGLIASTLTFKWSHFFWTLIEMGGMGGGGGGVFFFGTRAGVPLYFGPSGQHVLRFGLGFGGGPIGEHGAAVMLSPTAHYTYHTRGRFFVGVGLRTMMPITSDNCSSGGLETPTRCDFPMAVLISVPMGWSSRQW